MKKGLLSVLFLAAISFQAGAQSIIDAEENKDPNLYFNKMDFQSSKKAIPYPALRESDRIWEMVVWRHIDMNEKFNQFFYFPTETNNDTQGRINLVNAIVGALERGEIEVYEDADMTVVYDQEKALQSLMADKQKDTVVGIDEFDEDIVEQVRYKEPFDAATAKIIQIKEYWYIDKQDTRQKVRIVGLNFKYRKEVTRAGETTEDDFESFWVPMDDMRVRNVLVNALAYDENNDIVERSYDDIFIQRMFDSYIVRESNTYNRSISDYLTGEDAILQSQIIEDKIFDAESDMWEY